MKKLILTASILISSFSLSADEGLMLKPAKGNITTQVGIAVSTFMSPVNSFGFNGRYFLQDRLAIRASIIVDNSKTTDNFFENANGTGGSGSFTSSTSSKAFLIGVEKHFAGTKRLSPYFSLDLGFGGGREKNEGENSDGTNFIGSYKESEDIKFSGLMVNAGLGFDYWFTDGMYIGAEYSFLSFSSMTSKESTKEMTAGPTTTKVVTPESKSSGLSTLNAVPVFRLGWRIK